MSTKMIGFAIVGLIAIIVVNILFYRELKKTFKERKLIWYDSKPIYDMIVNLFMLLTLSFDTVFMFA